MAEETVVSYDVSKAISALENLEKAQDRIVEAIKTGFKEAGEASERLEQKLEAPSGGLSKLAENAHNTFAAFNNAVSAVGTFVDGALSLVDTVAEVAFGFESAGSEVEEFVNKLDELREFENLFSNIGNSIRNAALKNELKEIGLESAKIRQRLQEINAEQKALQVKPFQTTRRDPSTGKVTTSEIDPEKGTAVDRFRDTINGKIVEKKRQITAEEKATIAAAQGVVSAQNQKLENEKAILQAKQAQLRVDRQTIALGAESESNRQSRDEAARSFRDAVEGAGEAIAQQEGGFEKFINALKNPLREIGGDAQLLDDLREAEALAGRIQEQLAKDPTPGGVIALEGMIQEYVEAVTAVKDAPGLKIPPTASLILDRMETVGESFKQALESAGQFGAAGGGIKDNIEESSGSAIKLQSSMSTLSADAERQASAWERIAARSAEARSNISAIPSPNIPAQSGGGAVTKEQLQAAGLLDSPAPAAPVTQNQNFNIQIKGGMLDADTMRQISEFISREVRRGTSK